MQKWQIEGECVYRLDYNDRGELENRDYFIVQRTRFNNLEERRNLAREICDLLNGERP